jgi:hypothetical protein
VPPDAVGLSGRAYQFPLGSTVGQALIHFGNCEEVTSRTSCVDEFFSFALPRVGKRD